MPSVTLCRIQAMNNQAAFLRECLDSIFEQSAAVDFEIILVDDASTDETDALVQRYSDMRISYVRHERNSGLVSTLNDGFRGCKAILLPVLTAMTGTAAIILSGRCHCSRPILKSDSCTGTRA